MVVNYSTHTAEVLWQPARLPLSHILAGIHELGFQAWPFHHKQKALQQTQAKRTALLHIGSAALFGMQVMMISIGLYFGAWNMAWDMDADMQRFLHWVAMLLTVPVMVYSGQSFFINAWRDLKNRSLSMDVPVVLGLTIAFIGSALATVSGRGEVYFDSICVLILLLLISRYFEFQTRLDANRHLEKLYRVKPDTANKITPAPADQTDADQTDANQIDVIPAIKLQPGDLILVYAGEHIPVDGVVMSGDSAVDEALLTGEARPVTKKAGDALIAGSTNMYAPLTVEVTAVGNNTRLQQILRLIEQGHQQKPRLTAIINRFAGGFVMAVILIACVTGVYWYLHDASSWLGVTIAVLVVTCPCALSLATPTAYTAANNAMLGRGVAVLGQNVLQALAAAQVFIFDKTGTLTTGEMQVSGLTLFSGLSKAHCLKLAASLEAKSDHQIARAIRAAADHGELLPTCNLVNHPGAGVTAKIDQCHYFLGSAAFINRQTGLLPEQDESAGDTLDETIGMEVFLTTSTAVLCAIGLEDYPRPGVGALVSYLNAQAKQTILLSGDRQRLVVAIGDKLGFDEAIGAQLPEGKLAYLQEKIDRGDMVVMVGDGINDAPALAVSPVSIAMGNGADISKLNADMILLNSDLMQITEAHQLARRFVRVLKQNILWAVGYNLLALPLAIAGILTPWLAAIGMSVSSLIVVLNSTRLARLRTTA